MKMSVFNELVDSVPVLQQEVISVFTELDKRIQLTAAAKSDYFIYYSKVIPLALEKLDLLLKGVVRSNPKAELKPNEQVKDNLDSSQTSCKLNGGNVTTNFSEYTNEQLIAYLEQRVNKLKVTFRNIFLFFGQVDDSCNPDSKLDTQANEDNKDIFDEVSDSVNLTLSMLVEHAQEVITLR